MTCSARSLDVTPSRRCPSHCEGPERSGSGGVRIGADDECPGQREPLLGQDLVTDPTPHVIEVRDSLLRHELADGFVVLRVLRRRGRAGVIEHHHVDVGPRHALHPNLAEDPRDGGGVVVAERHIGRDFNDLPGYNFGQMGLLSQNLFSKCVTHRSLLC